MTATETGPRSARRALVASAALLLAGLLPVALGRGHPVTLLAWLSIVALPAGWLAGGWNLPLGRTTLAVGGLWYVGLLVSAERGVPAPHWAALAWTGLFVAGFGAGCLAPRRALAGAALALLLAALLVSLPGAAGLPEEPVWSPRAAARLLDLSPATLLVESAGVDWMRQPAVYGPAGADAIGPDLRMPWRGELAGPAVLLLGCALALAARYAVARRAHSKE